MSITVCPRSVADIGAWSASALGRADERSGSSDVASRRSLGRAPSLGASFHYDHHGERRGVSRTPDSGTLAATARVGRNRAQTSSSMHMDTSPARTALHTSRSVHLAVSMAHDRAVDEGDLSSSVVTSRTDDGDAVAGSTAAGRVLEPLGRLQDERSARTRSVTFVGYQVTHLSASEIFDSKRHTVIGVHFEVAGSAVGIVAAVSGTPCHGDDVPGVVALVNGEIADLVQGRTWHSLSDFDSALNSLVPSAGSEQLGAKATIGVSMAAARAFARADDAPLYQWLPHPAPPRLPVPNFHVLSGGRDAKNRVDFRGFMIAPLNAPSFTEAMRAGAEVYSRLRDSLGRIGFSTELGGDGEFVPALQAPEDMLDLLCGAISDAGYEPGPQGIAIALDLSASEFRDPEGIYHVNGSHLDVIDMVEYLAYLVDRYPIYSVEDGMAEDDPKGWGLLTERLGDRVELVGGDNLATSPTRIANAITRGEGTAALVGLDQVATVTEALDAVRCCYAGGFGAMVSHRSCETSDTFVAEFAVASGCGLMKAASPACGERAAQYGCLMSIEAEGRGLPYGRYRP